MISVIVNLTTIRKKAEILVGFGRASGPPPLALPKSIKALTEERRRMQDRFLVGGPICGFVVWINAQTGQVEITTLGGSDRVVMLPSEAAAFAQTILKASNLAARVHQEWVDSRAEVQRLATGFEDEVENMLNGAQI